MKRCLSISFVLILAACGGGDTTDTTDADSSNTPTTVGATTQSDAADTPATASETTQAPAEEPAPSPGGAGISLTIGDETWEFPAALCAYKYAPAGEAGSEWNVSHVNNGLQVYVADDEFGTLVSVADIENGGSPTVSWEAIGGAVEITVNSNDVTASGTFTDGVNGGTSQGTLTATCTDWFDAT